MSEVDHSERIRHHSGRAATISLHIRTQATNQILGIQFHTNLIAADFSLMSVRLSGCLH
ncbi:Hypothetical predicted protein [Xyrichtys novacula]|uniref:Uncharacterized protein n=1 Tax=Xyrichtys novacula TaxID=13765 RepID=A0AAV1EXH4_XYRNO|nr:Hypothetical predicted protein [Xyrichtys novacula]